MGATKRVKYPYSFIRVCGLRRRAYKNEGMVRENVWYRRKKKFCDMGLVRDWQVRSAQGQRSQEKEIKQGATCR